jgi:uncharacterized protein YpiB (UPF0302 family)
MVEKKDPAKFDFQMIRVGDANYRVPVLNTQKIGTILQKTHESARNNTQNDGAVKRQNKPNKPKVNYTHFLSIPVHTEVLEQNYNALKTKVLDENFRNLGAKNFTAPSLLHLTVLMLDLKDENRFNQAKKVLQGLENHI